MSDYPIDLANVALYLRKSRADFDAELKGEGETLSKHRTALLALAEKYRYVIQDTYEEVVSGERILDRPEMQRLLKSVHAGKYSAVLCMDIDRLGRGNMVDQGLIQEAFKVTDTLIITPRKVYDLKDELDEEWSEFEAFMARRELKIITRRLQRGRKQSASLGKSISKKPPFGYLRDDNLKLYPDPETAPVVRMIFSLSARGYGMTKVANHLTKLGIPTPSGKQTWERSSVFSILKNPVYQGTIVWGRFTYSKSSNVASHYTRDRQNPDDWLVAEDAHEPLVDSETLDRYLNRLQKTPKVTIKRELANPLASLIYCSQCGKAMARQQTYNRPTNRLLCKTFGCSTRSSSFELVESRLIQALREILSEMEIKTEPHASRSHVDYTSKRDLLTKQLTHATETIKELTDQRARLHDLLEQRVYDVQTFLERNRILEERLEVARKLLDEGQAALAEVELENQRQSGFVPRFVRVMTAYDMASTVKEKNELLCSIVERVKFTKQPEWKNPEHFELNITLRF